MKDSCLDEEIEGQIILKQMSDASVHLRGFLKKNFAIYTHIICELGLELKDVGLQTCH